MLLGGFAGLILGSLPKRAGALKTSLAAVPSILIIGFLVQSDTLVYAVFYKTILPLFGEGTISVADRGTPDVTAPVEDPRRSFTVVDDPSLYPPTKPIRVAPPTTPPALVRAKEQERDFLGNIVERKKDLRCESLQGDFYGACGKAKSRCRNVQTCVDFRSACPQPIETEGQCGSFNSCMLSQQKNTGLRNSCFYKWNDDPLSGQRNCEVALRTIDTMYNSCPGSGSANFRAKVFDYLTFDCSGHRSSFQTANTACYFAASDYLYTCGEAEWDQSAVLTPNGRGKSKMPDDGWSAPIEWSGLNVSAWSA